MDFLQLCTNRKSTRSFLTKRIPHAVLKQLIDAAVQSPSAGNCQPWHFFVIQDTAVLKAIHEKSYKASWFREAPAAIVVCTKANLTGERYGDRGHELYVIQDTAAAVMSILLQAESLGLGACWCGAFDEEAMREILHLDDTLRPVALIPVGYPKNPFVKKPPRKAMEDVVTYVYDDTAPPSSEDETEERICPVFVDLDLGCAVFNEVNLGAATFDHVNLWGASIQKVNLGGAAFMDVDLGGASFENANLSGTQFREVCINDASFSSLNFNNSTFQSVEFKNATFRGVNFEGARFENCSLPEDLLTGKKHE